MSKVLDEQTMDAQVYAIMAELRPDLVASIGRLLEQGQTPAQIHAHVQREFVGQVHAVTLEAVRSVANHLVRRREHAATGKRSTDRQVQWAIAALRAYADLHKEKLPDDPAASKAYIVALLVDLRHYCAAHGLDWYDIEIACETGFADEQAYARGETDDTNPEDWLP